MTDPLPPLGLLHAFVLVAETGSLTAAAARLNVTQPAVSKRLRQLEELLGVALVRRGANALRLTEEGTRYAATLGDAFARMRAATTQLSAQRQPVRVQAYTTWALRWLIPRLPRFRALHPQIEVAVATSTTMADFARRDLDAAVRSAPADAPPAPGAHRLQPVMIAPFAAPALAKAGGAMTLLGSQVRPGDWATWYQARQQVLPAAPLLFESTSLAIQAALEGLGVVICTPGFVSDDLRRRKLVALPGRPVPAGDSYWLILPTGTPRAEAVAFRDWLLAEAESIG